MGCVAGHGAGLFAVIDTVRRHAHWARDQSRLAREIQQLRAAARMLTVDKPTRAKAAEAAMDLAAQREQALDPNARRLLAQRAQASKASADETDDGEWLLSALSEQGLAQKPVTAQTDRGLETARTAQALAHGFESVMASLALGQPIDDALHHLTFEVSEGPSHAALASAARRIWSVAMHVHFGLPTGPAPQACVESDRSEAEVLAQLDAIANHAPRTP